MSNEENRATGQAETGRRIRWHGDRLVAALATLCVIFVLIAILAPLIAPHPPNKTDILNASAAPSPAHWLGTDDVGRDILSRLIFGFQLSLLGPAIVIAITTTFAIALSLSSVWIGGRYDRIVAHALNLLFSFPALLLAILCVAIFGAGIIAPSIALAVGFTPYMARVIRSVALRERHLPYIEACELAGMSGWRICLRHLLPNIMPIIRAHVTISFGSALIDLAAISYLGLGVQPPQAEWGLMVATGQSGLLAGHPWESLSACALILIVVITVSLLGERMTKQADEKS